jgi:hypothetical protein
VKSGVSTIIRATTGYPSEARTHNLLTVSQNVGCSTRAGTASCSTGPEWTAVSSSRKSGECKMGPRSPGPRRVEREESRARSSVMELRGRER